MRFRIPIRIETSSMLIGSSARTTLGSTASARAIATRCRCPPQSPCGSSPAMPPRKVGRVLRGNVLRGYEPDGAQQFVHPSLDLCRRDDVVDPEGPLDVMT